MAASNIAFQRNQPYCMINIKIFGVGCAKHRALLANVRNAVAELGLAANIEELDDIQQFFEHGITEVPSLVINEQILTRGRVATIKEIKEFLLAAAPNQLIS